MLTDINQKARTIAIIILTTTPNTVLLKKLTLVQYNNLQTPYLYIPAQSANKAIVILAIRPLGLSNRLPKFKILANYKSFQLKSSKILGTLYNTPQIFKGYRGRTTYISVQVRKVTTLQQPLQFKGQISILNIQEVPY